MCDQFIHLFTAPTLAVIGAKTFANDTGPCYAYLQL